jgi:mannose-6-phosphate isomerase-like protein (cupin superfamily)
VRYLEYQNTAVNNYKKCGEMKKEKVVKVSEICGFQPKESKGDYTSRLLIESEGVGSSKLMLVHATLKPGKAPGRPEDAGAVHPPPYDEAYYILRGHARVKLGQNEESYNVGPDTAIFIPSGTPHNIINTGTEDLEFLTIWPITPMEESVNPVYDERKREWGISFKKVGDKHNPR